MKKIAMILLAALLVLNTFACTGGSEKQAVNQPQDLEKTQPKCYLFSSANDVPMPEKEPKRFNYDEDKIKEMAKMSKMTFAQMVEKLKLLHDENGYYKMA